MIVFYMDDGTISGRARDVADAFERLRDLAMTKAGLSVSPRKSTVMLAYFRDEDAMDLTAMSSQELSQFFPSDIAVTKRLNVGRASCGAGVCQYGWHAVVEE